MEVLQFLRNNKRWWLLPFVVTLLCLAALLMAGQATAVGPSVYRLF